MKRKSVRSKPTRKTSARKIASRTPAKTSRNQNILAITAEIEKEFFGLPSKLVALCRREHATLREKDKKLQTQLKAAIAKQQTATKKLVALNKSKRKTSKTQLANTKKAITLSTRLVADLRRQCKTSQTACQEVAKKQAGFASLAKDLPKLRKQMLAAGRKTVKKPARQKKRIAKITTSSPYSHYQDELHRPISVPSTRTDTTDVT